MTYQHSLTMNPIALLNFSLFTFNATLTANSTSVSVSNATLDAVQVNNIYVVTINETFNISISIVDKVSRQRMNDLNWGGFNWTASVSLYTLLEHNGNGTLLTTTSSTIVIDTSSNMITATNLALTDVGMYVIKLYLNSTNAQHYISLTSNGILVKKNSSKLILKRENSLTMMK